MSVYYRMVDKLKTCGFESHSIPDPMLDQYWAKVGGVDPMLDQCLANVGGAEPMSDQLRQCWPNVGGADQMLALFRHLLKLKFELARDC